MITDTQQFIAIVPAAGIGKRMKANCPKQYLEIGEHTILFHTVTKLLSHSMIAQIIIVLGENDQYFSDSGLADYKNIIRVKGGAERVDSVLNGLKIIDAKTTPWVLVHDAARPCVSHEDIDQLIRECKRYNCGGLLASPVRDTMKRGVSVDLQHSDIENSSDKTKLSQVKSTVERQQLWHALTPQLYKTAELRFAIEEALTKELNITDESSAMESANFPSLLVTGSSENIKITHPSDLALAEFYLSKQSSSNN